MSYYHGLISSRRANSLLNQRQDGSFLLRDSQSQPGNFVLSAKCSGRMYHVLVFQQGGKYILDGPPEQQEGGGGMAPVQFDSLDELILFLTGHNLKVGEDEVQLTEICPCEEESARKSSNSFSRVRDSDDNDIMTDVFATLFGNRNVVISVAHSSLSIDGRSGGGGEGKNSYWVALVKDLELKGYFIRVVDKEEKAIVREKRVGKQFQYDMPSDHIMTFLAEDGITCIEFRDTQEKDKFLHQIDRIVKLQQERSIKLRDRSDSEATTHQKKPTEVVQRIKASDFDAEQLSPEWQYLFDEAGVTKEMLTNKASLQFILDTIYEIGGAPQNLSTITSDGLGQDTGEVEREKVIALDANLKKESVRASRLSDILQKNSYKISSSTSSSPSSSLCPYLTACEHYKDHLIIKHSMIALGPENAACFCEKCAAGKPVVESTGSPPQQYNIPVGWCQFIHSSQNHALSRHVSRRWHVAYCSVPSSRVASVMRTGQLLPSESGKAVVLSPDIECACLASSISPDGFHDNISGCYYQVKTVFQVFIQPATYTVQRSNANNESPAPLHSQLEWHATGRTYIVHSLWISMMTTS